LSRSNCARPSAGCRSSPRKPLRAANAPPPALGLPADRRARRHARVPFARNGEFTLNIALARDHAPVAGAVFAPASHRLWCAGRQARACRVAPGAPLPAPSEWRDLAVRRAPAAGLTALVSRSREDAEAEALLARLPIAERRAAGSSLKFCLIAEGEADVYPRFGRTMEWDTAAGDAILRAAGGCVLDPQGRRLAYGKTASAYANGPFVAWGDRAAAATLC
jgi:3'(2'), 5'-bisphosphate nucleotidase